MPAPANNLSIVASPTHLQSTPYEVLGPYMTISIPYPPEPITSPNSHFQVITIGGKRPWIDSPTQNVPEHQVPSKAAPQKWALEGELA